MDVKRYRNAIDRTMNPLPERDKLAMIALGIAGEAGELADYLKKVVFHGHEFDRDKLIEEVGDLFWYVFHLLKHFYIDEELVFIRNVMKLNKRYPHGFSQEDSKNRKV